MRSFDEERQAGETAQRYVGMVAEAVRAQFENGEVDRDLLVELYADYADVGDMTVFVREAEAMFPSLNCGLASVYVRHALGQGEIMNAFYGDQCHTFLIVDGLIVDITADQFDGPRVYVGPLAKPWSVA